MLVNLICAKILLVKNTDDAKTRNVIVLLKTQSYLRLLLWIRTTQKRMCAFNMRWGKTKSTSSQLIDHHDSCESSLHDAKSLFRLKLMFTAKHFIAS